MPTKDPRGGMPSASAIGQVEACPASQRLQRGLTDLRNDDEREWAASGDRIHKWLEGKELVNLDADELDVAERCLRDRDEIISTLAGQGTFVTGEPIQVFTETRIWWPRAGKRRTSGQADFTQVQGSVALVVDYKTSYGDQPASADNLQLRTLAVLTWRKHPGVTDVHVAIIQPLVGKPVVCHYDLAALEASERQLDHILTLADDGDAKPVAGHHCRFCRAKLTCPAALAVVDQVAAVPKNVELTGPQLAALLDKVAVAGMVGEAAKTLAKTRLAADIASVPGYGLESSGSTSTIDDVAAVHAGLVSAGYLDTPTFLTCIKIVKGDAEKAIALFKKVKLSVAKDCFKTVAEPHTTTKEKAKSLVKL